MELVYFLLFFLGAVLVAVCFYAVKLDERIHDLERAIKPLEETVREQRLRLKMVEDVYAAIQRIFLQIKKTSEE